MRDCQKTMKTPAMKILHLAFFAVFAMTLLPTDTHAQTPTPAVPNAAQADLDKNGLQVVEIGGKKMTFFEISALLTEQKRPILKKLGDLDAELLEDYFYFERARVKQDNARIKAETKAI